MAAASTRVAILQSEQTSEAALALRRTVTFVSTGLLAVTALTAVVGWIASRGGGRSDPGLRLATLGVAALVAGPLLAPLPYAETPGPSALDLSAAYSVPALLSGLSVMILGWSAAASPPRDRWSGVGIAGWAATRAAVWGGFAYVGGEAHPQPQLLELVGGGGVAMDVLGAAFLIGCVQRFLRRAGRVGRFVSFAPLVVAALLTHLDVPALFSSAHRRRVARLERVADNLGLELADFDHGGGHALPPRLFVVDAEGTPHEVTERGHRALGPGVVVEGESATGCAAIVVTGA